MERHRYTFTFFVLDEVHIFGTEIRNNDFGTQSGTISQQIDVSDFQMGLYLIRVFHGAISESKTFMKN